jgi:uncharacterized protein (DUF433 family)
MKNRVFESDETVKGGEPVFPNTRVPISLLFAMLKSGSSINEFFEDFPTVAKEQVNNLLEASEESLIVAEDTAFTYRETKEELERLRNALADATEALLITAGNYPKEEARKWTTEIIRQK